MHKIKYRHDFGDKFIATLDNRRFTITREKDSKVFFNEHLYYGEPCYIVKTKEILAEMGLNPEKFAIEFQNIVHHVIGSKTIYIQRNYSTCEGASVYSEQVYIDPTNVK